MAFLRSELEPTVTLQESETLGLEAAERCREAFKTHGVFLIRCPGRAWTPATLLSFLLAHFEELDWGKDYLGGANPRLELGAHVYDVGVPDCADVLHHHEMQYKQATVRSLAFACAHAFSEPDKVVPTELGDAKAAARYLKSHAPALRRRLSTEGVIYVRALSDKSRELEAEQYLYNHWQASFRTEKPEEAESRATAAGLEIQWTSTERAGTVLETQFRAATFEKAEDGEEVLFATPADSEEWFRTWPGFENLTPEDSPMRMSYGGGAPILDEERRLWWEAVRAETYDVKWETGDVLVVCNFRWSHGRKTPRFGSAGRSLLLALGGTAARSRS